MKFIFYSLLLLVGLAACKDAESINKADSAANQNIPDVTQLTSIQWIDSVKQFGSIREGEKIMLSFRFKNTGSKPLIIETVNPGCGCTVAEMPNAPIAPGAESEIKAAFDSKGRPGATYKTIEVTCNTETGKYLLSFEGEVIPNK